jgi:hypothetical protein
VATVVTVECIRKKPKFMFCLRLEEREVGHWPIVERGKVVLVEE